MTLPARLESHRLAFPPPETASPEGIVAFGGDASPERLLLAYGQGIFPWPHEGYPLLWFSPDPRFVLDLANVTLSRSLRKTIRKGAYEIRFDTRFRDVMLSCRTSPRRGQSGTWITPELISGFSRLHESGFAHSVEAYQEGELVGGLYGMSLGEAFFGESMFASRPDASKVAFATLLAHLASWGFGLVDCQVYTDHLARFGAEEMPRSLFLSKLRRALERPTRLGPWRRTLEPDEVLAALDRGDGEQP
jgi:leucyl/phenylalanyl-tRNA---protein transferase